MISPITILMKSLLMVLSLAVVALAAQPKCKGNPKVISACFSVHGRLQLGADSIVVRLWPVGTKRIWGVAAGPTIDDAGDPIFPENVKFKAGDDAIFGDFEVCPFTPERKGRMRMVCIESASHLVAKHEVTEWP